MQLLTKDGWYVDRQRGSHVIFRHPVKRASLTVAAGGKLNTDIKPGTLHAILKQAGLRE